jgi:hypothetical protein
MKKELEVIVPRTDADLRRLKELDRQGKLASGKSYPTAEQLATLGPVAESEEVRRIV